MKSSNGKYKYKYKSSKSMSKKKKNDTATKKYVKTQISKLSETKYFEFGLPPTAVDWAGTLVPVALPTQGTTDSQRIGDKITLKALKFNYQVSAGDPTNLFRVMVIQWIPNVSLVSPSISNILNSTTLSTVNAPLAMSVWDYQNQYIILYDAIHQLETLYKASVVVRKNINLRYAKKTIEFTAASTNAANQIFLVFVSDSGSVTHPSINYQVRTLYDDA